MTNDLHTFLAAALKPELYQRKGQRFANHLTIYRPELLEELKLRGLDPFYDDSKLWKAVDFIRQHWNDGEETNKPA